jgi:predicted  nucleic acid-binding Zn-ribbon protein
VQKDEEQMSVEEAETPTVVPFAPNKRGQNMSDVDHSGHHIVALLEKAADKTKADCARAMDLAHKLTLQLRAAEDRVRDLETEAAHYRDRAVRAEDWLQHIHNEVEQTFFQKEEAQPPAPKRNK